MDTFTNNAPKTGGNRGAKLKNKNKQNQNQNNGNQQKQQPPHAQSVSTAPVNKNDPTGTHFNDFTNKMDSTMNFNGGYKNNGGGGSPNGRNNSYNNFPTNNEGTWENRRNSNNQYNGNQNNNNQNQSPNSKMRKGSMGSQMGNYQNNQNNNDGGRFNRSYSKESTSPTSPSMPTSKSMQHFNGTQSPNKLSPSNSFTGPLPQEHPQQPISPVSPPKMSAAQLLEFVEKTNKPTKRNSVTPPLLESIEQEKDMVDTPSKLGDLTPPSSVDEKENHLQAPPSSASSSTCVSQYSTPMSMGNDISMLMKQRLEDGTPLSGNHHVQRQLVPGGTDDTYSSASSTSSSSLSSSSPESQKSVKYNDETSALMTASEGELSYSGNESNESSHSVVENTILINTPKTEQENEEVEHQTVPSSSEQTMPETNVSVMIVPSETENSTEITHEVDTKQLSEQIEENKIEPVVEKKTEKVSPADVHIEQELVKEVSTPIIESAIEQPVSTVQDVVMPTCTTITPIVSDESATAKPTVDLDIDENTYCFVEQEEVTDMVSQIVSDVFARAQEAVVEEKKDGDYEQQPAQLHITPVFEASEDMSKVGCLYNVTHKTHYEPAVATAAETTEAKTMTTNPLDVSFKKDENIIDLSDLNKTTTTVKASGKKDSVVDCFSCSIL